MVEEEEEAGKLAATAVAEPTTIKVQSPSAQRAVARAKGEGVLATRTTSWRVDAISKNRRRQRKVVHRLGYSKGTTNDQSKGRVCRLVVPDQLRTNIHSSPASLSPVQAFNCSITYTMLSWFLSTYDIRADSALLLVFRGGMLVWLFSCSILPASR